jgi:hypothetical protein
MHRSGTSVATRLIDLLGVSAPIHDDLLPPDEGNPTGYWESSSLVQFNDRLLAALESDLTCPIAFPPGWEGDPRLAGLQRDALATFARAFPGGSWVFKDPRNCLTFRFWVRTLGVEPLVILIHRNPCEIAASFRSHWGDSDGIPYLFALWERYLRQALSNVEGRPVFMTSYEDVVSEPVAWCKGVADFLLRSGMDIVSPPQDVILDFVDPDLRHESFTRDDFLESPAGTDAQRALFVALENLQGVHPSFSAPELPPETPTTEALLAERRRSLRIKQDLPSERLARGWRRVRSSRYFGPARHAYHGLRHLGA